MRPLPPLVRLQQEEGLEEGSLTRWVGEIGLGEERERGREELGRRWRG